MEIEEIPRRQRAFYAAGATKDPAFRVRALEKLRTAILANEKKIYAALRADLNKSEFEAYMSELGMVLDELRFVIRHMRKWARETAVPTPVSQFYSRSFKIPEPYGVVLIMAPWNYPFQLTIAPLIGALAAGNCAVIKPSEYAPAAARVLSEILSGCFEPEYVAVVQGGREVSGELLKQRFDYIFFTGSVSVGKIVMKSAAEHLTPVCLELGGKSPCIVDQTANLKIAARRIAFGKFLNAGQTCVAPDYILVHRSVKDALVENLKREINGFYGAAPLKNGDYPKIINQKHFNRLVELIKSGSVLLGGESDPASAKIAPTLLGDVPADSALMTEEIFGPVLPILTFETMGEALSFVGAREKPLAVYLFTQDRAAEKRVLSSLSFGGGCVNDTIIHLATPYLGFGGVGESGMGSYHGKASFDTFSHYKSVVHKSCRIDLPLRYFPATARKLKLIKLFLHG